MRPLRQRSSRRSFRGLVCCAALLPALAMRVSAQAPVSCDTTETRMLRDSTPDGLLAAQEYVALERALQGRLAGSLAADDRRFFEGVLANRRNQLDRSVDLLRGWLASRAPADTAERVRQALHALADDYMKLFRYRDAGRGYDELEARFGARMPAAQREGNRESATVRRALAGVPPQTLTAAGPFTLAARRDSLGLAEVPVAVGRAGSKPEWWIFDTGANITAITASTARRLGLTFSAESTSVQGTTGALVPIRMSSIDELRLGGATVRHVAVIILPDSALYVAPLKFQMQAILGYPVIAALGEVTVFGMDSLRVRPSPYHDRAPDANLYLEQLTPLVAASVNGQEHLYRFDSGADASIFTVRYCATYRDALAGASVGTYGVGGAGGNKRLPALVVPRLVMSVGGTSVTLTDARVLTGPMGGRIDQSYGNLGQDLVRQAGSYTIDFRGMRFTLGEKR